MFTPERFVALGTVIVIDLVLSGDNAIVIGLVGSGSPTAMRREAIVHGAGAATVPRVVFALITFQLLKIIGLTLAGGPVVGPGVRQHDFPGIQRGRPGGAPSVGAKVARR